LEGFFRNGLFLFRIFLNQVSTDLQSWSLATRLDSGDRTTIWSSDQTTSSSRGGILRCAYES
jgi:hypothetical protein